MSWDGKGEFYPDWTVQGPGKFEIEDDGEWNPIIVGEGLPDRNWWELDEIDKPQIDWSTDDAFAGARVAVFMAVFIATVAFVIAYLALAIVLVR